MIDNTRLSESPAQKPVQQYSPKKTASNRGEGLRNMLSTIAVLLIAPVIAVFLTVFVFQSYQVDGESMETTLSHNDRLVVWKLPKTWSKLTNHTYIPNRGDVVVFTEPALSQFGQDPGKQLIKRVIGLPGERVTVDKNVVTVYNQEHPEGFQPDDTLPYGDVIKSTSIDGDWQIGDNQIFVLGDNRGNSLDSRTFGPIDADNVVGKLIIRILPLSEIKKF